MNGNLTGTTTTIILVSTIMIFGILLVDSTTLPIANALLDYEYVDDFGRFGILYDGRFSHPQHIAQDHEGNLYITDLGNKRIQKFDSNGTYLDQWGRSGKGTNEFHEPTGIAINQNLVYVVDRDLHRVQVFNLDGKYVTQWGERGTTESKFSFPTGVAIGINGTVYVVDSGNQRIQSFTFNGTFLNSIGTSGTGTGEFLNIIGVRVDSVGNVYGVDKGNSKIAKFDSQGNHTQTIKFDASNWAFTPQSIDIANDDSLFILNSIDNKILHLDQDGHSTLMTRERLGPFGNFLTMGSDILLSNTGHLYIVDSLGHKIFKYNTPFVGKAGYSVLEQQPSPPLQLLSPNSTSLIVNSTTDLVNSTKIINSTNIVNSTKLIVDKSDNNKDNNNNNQPSNPPPSSPDACGQPLSSYNVITGTDNNDILEGTPAADLIFGLGGNDIISGYAGNDCIFGGDGDDIIFGNDGSDGIFGDQGNDTIKGAAGDDVIYGNYGSDSIDGGIGHDTCIAADVSDTDQVSNCESI